MVTPVGKIVGGISLDPNFFCVEGLLIICKSICISHDFNIYWKEASLVMVQAGVSVFTAVATQDQTSIYLDVASDVFHRSHLIYARKSCVPTSILSKSHLRRSVNVITRRL